MARVHVELPEGFDFQTEIPVLSEHVNSANHVGNHNLVAMINEANIRYARSIGLQMHVAERNWSLVNADLEVSYRSEAHYGEDMIISLAVASVHRCGFDFVSKLHSSKDQRLVAVAKVAYICLDRAAGRAMTMPEDARSILPKGR